MNTLLGIYVVIIAIAQAALLIYLYYERFHAFKSQGDHSAREILKEHFEKIRMEEQAILEDFRNSMKGVIAQTQLTGQQNIEHLNEYMIQSHTESLGRFNEFSAKLYSVLVDSGNHFSLQLQQYVKDANKKIDQWQDSYIQIMKTEIDQIIQEERQKLTAFTEDEQKRIEQYMREMVTKELSLIVEEVLSNSISLKDQEKLATQAIEKFFKEN